MMAKTGVKKRGVSMAKHLVSVVLLTLIVVCSAISRADDVSMMTKEQLGPMLGRNDLVILDVRTPYDWKKSDAKIKGAIREDPMQFRTWMAKYPKEKTIVLYCA